MICALNDTYILSVSIKSFNFIPSSSTLFQNIKIIRTSATKSDLVHK